MQSWFSRGGNHSNGINAGIFYFNISSGNSGGSNGFRSVISYVG